MDAVYIGADHRGFQLKNQIKEHLTELGYFVTDLGNMEYDKDDDYFDWAIGVAEKVASERAWGVLVCGSGIGVCIAANKVGGVRAAMCTSVDQAKRARREDDANILCLAAELVGEEVNKEIVDAFLNELFSSEEKYIRRVKKIRDYEFKKG